jgi:hypothetical protein
MTMPEEAGTAPDARLQRAIAGLAVSYGIERSIKIRSGRVLTNRSLLSVARASLGEHANRSVLDVCRCLNMPALLLDRAATALSEASIVHFGFEEDAPDRLFFKCYLEFERRFRERPPSDGGSVRPIELHLAFKWLVNGGGEHAVAHYVCYPGLDRSAMLRRLADIYTGQKKRTPWNVACDVVSAAERRVGLDDVMYLEVEEDETARRSFDLNVYRAGLPVGFLEPALAALSAHFALASSTLDDALAAVRTRTLGHIAGGVDRHHRDFFTMYFGVESR